MLDQEAKQLVHGSSQSKDFLHVGVGRAERLSKAHAAGRAAISGQRFLGSLGGVLLRWVEFLIADEGHQSAEPLAGLPPVVRDIDERVGLTSDRVPRAVVVL